MSDVKTIVEEKNDNIMYIFRNAVSSAMNQGYSAKDVFDSMKAVVDSFEKDAKEIVADLPKEEEVVAEVPVAESPVEEVVAEDIVGGDNPLANIRSNILEFPNGEVLYVGYKDGKIFAGEATNVGVVHDFEMDYDKDSSVDINLQNLYDYITEKRPSLLQKEDEMPTLDKDDRVKEAILEEVEETYPCDTFIQELPTEVQDRIMDKVEEKLIKDHPDWDDSDIELSIEDAYNGRLCDLEDIIDVSPFVDDYKTPVKGKVLTETSEEEYVNLVALINSRFGDLVAETQEELNDSDDEDEDYEILRSFWDDLFLVTDGEISDEERNQLFFDGDDLDGDPTKVCKDILWDLFSIQNLSFESSAADEIGLLDETSEDRKAFYAEDDDEISNWFKEEE